MSLLYISARMSMMSKSFDVKHKPVVKLFQCEFFLINGESKSWLMMWMCSGSAEGIA